MDYLYASMILAYWLFLSGVIFLSGAFASRIYITGPSGAEACLPGSGNKCFGETATRYIFLVAVLTLLANAVHLVLHSAIMTETPLRETFSILPLFIAKTKYGRFTLWRTLFVALITVISLVRVRNDAKWVTPAGFVLALLLLAVIAMSGHQGVKGYANPAFFADVVHLAAVSLWIGGIFFIRFFLARFVKGAYREFRRNITVLINRFSVQATWCFIVSAVTGGMLAFANVKETSVLLGSSYGIILLVKIFLVAVIAVIGGMNKFTVIPRLNSVNTDSEGVTQALGRRLLTLVNLEAGLGLLVLLLTSLLTHLSPAG